MRHLHALPFLLALACAAPTPTREASRREGARPDAAQLAADVVWLADDAREGRRAGTRGGLEAGAWLAERLTELGLEPAGEAGFVQRFDVPLDPRSGGGSWLEGGPWSAGGRVAEASGALAPLFCSERGEVAGELVLCGYGIESDEHGWNDFAGLALEGRVAAILRGAPPVPAEPEAGGAGREAPAEAAANPHGDVQLVARDAWGGAATIFVKVMNAKRRGAKGVILLPDPEAPDEPLLEFDGASPARAGIPCVTAAFPPGADRARIAELARTPPAERGALDPLEGARGSKDPVRLFADVERLRGEATNVLGRVRGARPGRTVLVCAHYDHLGLGGSGSLAPGERGQVHNGADDNASGTAVALEVARLFAERPPERGDLVVALWSGEELGLLGSEHWAEHPTFPLEELALVINLDMVGRAHQGLVALGAGSAAPLAGWLEDLGERSDLALEVVASGQGVGGSDHQTFLKREVPAVHLFTGLHEDYHRPSDDVERFEAPGAAEICALTEGLARRALDGADALAWVPPPEPKEGGRKIQSGFSAWFGSIPSYTFEGPGVLFDGISPGSPAERAGLLKGDVLRRLGDVEIDTIYDFTYALQRYKAGDVVRVVYLRDGERQELSLALSSRGVK